MKYGPYKVNSVAGKPIISNLLSKDGVAIDNIAFDESKFELNGSFKGGQAKVVSDLCNTSVTLEEDFCDKMYETYPPLKGSLYIIVKFKIDNYTVQTKEVPVEMTLEEIEKKLGHKIVLMSGDPKNNGKAKL